MKYLRSLFNKPLSWLIHGSALMATLFIVLTMFYPNPPWPIWNRIGIGAIIWSPSLIGIPIAETYYRAREGTLKNFLKEVFSSWNVMFGLGFVLAACSFVSKVGLPLSILIGIIGGIGAPLHGAMSGSFFSRMIKRGLM